MQNPDLAGVHNVNDLDMLNQGWDEALAGATNFWKATSASPTR